VLKGKNYVRRDGAAPLGVFDDSVAQQNMLEAKVQLDGKE
jgi:hypothetical protein